MKNEHESTKLVLGLIIGGVIGAGALYCAHAAQNQKTPVLKKIGKTISNVGEMLENCEIDSAADVMESIERKLPKGAEIVSNLADWVDVGTSLWQKFRKG